MDTLKTVSRLYRFSAYYGLIALVPQYFLETKTGVDFPPPITHPEFFYGFIGVAIAWQLTFLQIAKDPVRLRPIMLGGVFEKAAFGVAALVLFAQGRAPSLIASSGALDLIFAGAFYWAYVKTPQSAS